MLQPGQSENSSRRRLVINIAVIAAIVVVVLVIWLVTSAVGSGEAQSRTVLVHDGDGATTQLPLDENTTRTFTTSKGTNVVVVEDGSVYVSEADCPNHDCMQQGAISEMNRQIVCLPHELWIEIVETDDSYTSATDGDKIDVVGS